MREINLNLSEAVFLKAVERAKKEGFETTEGFLSRVITDTVTEDPDSYDYLFTPERLSELDRIAASVDAGAKMFTAEEVKQSVAEHRKAYKRK